MRCRGHRDDAGLRRFTAFTAKLWNFFIYLLRRQIHMIIQYQTVRYDILLLSPLSRNRLGEYVSQEDYKKVKQGFGLEVSRSVSFLPIVVQPR